MKIRLEGNKPSIMAARELLSLLFFIEHESRVQKTRLGRYQKFMTVELKDIGKCSDCGRQNVILHQQQVVQRLCAHCIIEKGGKN